MNWTLDVIVNILQALASIVVIVGIIFLLIQTSQLIKQTNLSATSTISALYQEVASRMMEIDELFVTSPHLRPYFYGNKPTIALDEVTLSQVNATAEMFLDFMDLTVVLRRMASETGSDQHVQFPLFEWGKYFMDVYDTSPAMKNFLNEHKDWYVEPLNNLLINRQQNK